jgi:hypothetical protein
MTDCKANIATGDETAKNLFGSGIGTFDNSGANDQRGFVDGIKNSVGEWIGRCHGADA